MPIRSLPETKNGKLAPVFGEASIIGCEKYVPKSKYELDCNSRSTELVDDLKNTKLFSKVTIGNSEADYLIELKPYSRYPYYHSIGHNPGVLVLSAVIPFWEQYEYGNDFTIQKRGESQLHRVNTLDSGTYLMWSGSILINMFPSRGIPGTFYQNEVKYLRDTIINVAAQ